jgi:hypothetical protein
MRRRAVVLMPDITAGVGVGVAGLAAFAVLELSGHRR